MVENHNNLNNNIAIIPLVTQVEKSESEEDIDTFTSSIIVEEEKKDEV